MKKGMKRYLLVIALVVFMSFSYAFFSYVKKGTTGNTIKSDKITFHYEERSRGITLSDALPVSDAIGTVQDNYFDFYITSTTPDTVQIPYDITIEKTKNSYAGMDGIVKFYLTKVDDNGDEESVGLNSINVSNIVKYSELDLYENEEVNVRSEKGEKLLYQEKVPENSKDYEQKYRLRMWIDDKAEFIRQENGVDTYPYQGKSYGVKVNVYGKGVKIYIQKEIQLHANGGTLEHNTIIRSVEKNFGTIEEPVREGYVFTGWYRVSDFKSGTGVGIDTVVTRNITDLYANYTRGIYTLNVDVDNATYEKEKVKQLEYEEEYDLGKPIKEGHIFTGWEVVSGNGTISGNILRMGSRNVSVRPIWAKEKSKLSIVDSNTCDISDYEIEYNGTYEVCVPEKEGYTFAGWEVSNGTINGNTFTMGPNDAVLRATWVANDYKWIVYHNKMNVDGNGYTLAEVETGTEKYDSKFKGTLKNYVGFTNPEQKEKKIVVDKKTGEEGYPTNNTLDYNYERNKSRLTVDLNGGNSGTNSHDVYYGRSINLEATRPGYSLNTIPFTKISGDGVLSGSTLTMGLEPTEVRANWTANTYTITFNVNGGDTLPIGEQTKEVTYDLEYGELPTPSREHYTFDGWYTDTSYTEKVEKTSTVDIIENKTLYAKWNRIQYTITYNANGGSNAPTAQTYNSGDKVSIVQQKPTKTDNLFLGWSESSSATSATYLPSNDYEISGNKTLYAVWLDRIYLYNRGDEQTSITGGWTLNVNQKNGTGQKNSNSLLISYAAYGMTQSEYHTGNLNIPTSFYKLTINYRKDVVYETSKWVQLYYKIGDEDLVKSDKSEVGTYTETFDVGIANGTKLSLGNWDSFDYIYQVYLTPSTKAASAIIISYNLNGGTGGLTQKDYVYENSTITVPLGIPTKDGYFFAGWSESPTATTATYLPGKTYTISSSKTLYAVWQTNTNIQSSANRIIALSENKISIAGSDEQPTKFAISYSSLDNKLYTSMDDRGGTYYFRGAPTYNYVKFAGYCWRIVRINADGSYRLIFDGLSNTCYANGTVSTNRQATTSKFNDVSSSDANYNTYVGYMYGSKTATTYAATHANTNNSTIKTNLDNWYTTNLASYDSKLSDMYFCNDRSVMNSTGIGTDVTQYGGRIRLGLTLVPTLLCPQVNNDLFTTSGLSIGNRKLTKKIGLLSFDEVMYTGFYDNSADITNHYLNIGSVYWLSTATETTSVSVASSGGGRSVAAVYGNYGLRPVINLKASAFNNATGKGTYDNPFIIN